MSECLTLSHTDMAGLSTQSCSRHMFSGATFTEFSIKTDAVSVLSSLFPLKDHKNIQQIFFN